jgi:hypothetical protein
VVFACEALQDCEKEEMIAMFVKGVIIFPSILFSNNTIHNSFKRDMAQVGGFQEQENI